MVNNVVNCGKKEVLLGS